MRTLLLLALTLPALAQTRNVDLAWDYDLKQGETTWIVCPADLSTVTKPCFWGFRAAHRLQGSTQWAPIGDFRQESQENGSFRKVVSVQVPIGGTEAPVEFLVAALSRFPDGRLDKSEDAMTATFVPSKPAAPTGLKGTITGTITLDLQFEIQPAADLEAEPFIVPKSKIQTMEFRPSDHKKGNK